MATKNYVMGIVGNSAFFTESSHSAAKLLANLKLMATREQGAAGIIKGESGHHSGSIGHAFSAQHTIPATLKVLRNPKDLTEDVLVHDAHGNELFFGGSDWFIANINDPASNQPLHFVPRLPCFDLLNNALLARNAATSIHDMKADLKRPAGSPIVRLVHIALAPDAIPSLCYLHTPPLRQSLRR